MVVGTATARLLQGNAFFLETLLGELQFLKLTLGFLIASFELLLCGRATRWCVGRAAVIGSPRRVELGVNEVGLVVKARHGADYNSGGCDVQWEPVNGREFWFLTADVVCEPRMDANGREWMSFLTANGRELTRMTDGVASDLWLLTADLKHGLSFEASPKKENSETPVGLLTANGREYFPRGS
jgi:hypothetical protein